VAVDPQWLAKIRRKNQQAFDMPGAMSGMAGMAGMGGLGYVSSQDLVGAIDREREIRTASVHQGRFERTDPNRPKPGSVESIAAALPGGNLPPPPPPIPRAVIYVSAFVALGLVGVFLLRRKEG